MVKRRQVVKGIGAGITASLAGCTGSDNQDQNAENADEAYRFYFEDETGALGSIGESQTPEDVSDQQVVNNTRSEEQWQEMQLNDHHYARRILDERNIPHFEVTEVKPGEIDGVIADVEEATLDIYEEKTQRVEGEDPEAFTESVLEAVIEETDASTGASQGHLTRDLAEYILENNGIEIENYRLSKMRSMIGQYPDRGFSHPMGLLQWDENGETQVRYAEVESRMTETVVQPEESVYASDIDSDDFTAGGYVDTEPGDWVSVFDFQKLRELQERGELGKENPGANIIAGLIYNIDGAATSRHMHQVEEANNVETGVEAQFGGTDGSIGRSIDAVVSDSFGESLESYVRSPGEDYDREDFETSTRAIFTATENQDFTGAFALDGDISDPEVYRATEEQIEEIRANDDYDNIASIVTG